MKLRAPIAVLLCAAASAAFAQQQLYRWTDENGRVHITDTPPPASARNVQKKSSAGNVAESQQGFELSQAVRNFPVTLYTAQGCKACADARSHLNKRGVPFTEILVGDDKSRAELKSVSGGEDVPTVLVGRSVHRGFTPDSYDALLDSARYPKTGASPARAQAAPPDPNQPKPEPAPTGPYAPKPRGY